MSIGTISILGTILGLAATILAFVYIVPESGRAANSNPFFKFLHNLFNFKTLWIEKILKFCYVLATLVTVTQGILMLTWTVQKINYYSREVTTIWNGYWGLLVIILGPIAIRIIYESIMMFILLVTNTIEINQKLSKKSENQTNKESNNSEQ